MRVSFPQRATQTKTTVNMSMGRLKVLVQMASKKEALARDSLAFIHWFISSTSTPRPG